MSSELVHLQHSPPFFGANTTGRTEGLKLALIKPCQAILAHVYLLIYSNSFGKEPS